MRKSLMSLGIVGVFKNASTDTDYIASYNIKFNDETSTKTLSLFLSRTPSGLMEIFYPYLNMTIQCSSEECNVLDSNKDAFLTEKVDISDVPFTCVQYDDQCMITTDCFKKSRLCAYNLLVGIGACLSCFTGPTIPLCLICVGEAGALIDLCKGVGQVSHLFIISPYQIC